MHGGLELTQCRKSIKQLAEANDGLVITYQFSTPAMHICACKYLCVPSSLTKVQRVRLLRKMYIGHFLNGPCGTRICHLELPCCKIAGAFLTCCVFRSITSPSCLESQSVYVPVAKLLALLHRQLPREANACTKPSLGIGTQSKHSFIKFNARRADMDPRPSLVVQPVSKDARPINACHLHEQL